MTARALGGVPLVSFEAQRAQALTRLFSRHGATVLRAPAVREASVPASPGSDDLVRRLRARGLEALLLLTGVGTRALSAAVARTAPDFPTLLARTALVTCGAGALTAVRELGLRDAHRVPPPHTWREILSVVDALGLPLGAAVAVQEYGQEPTALLLGLQARGHEVLRVPVYRWALPDDLAPLHRGIEAICRREARIAVFTSPVQVEHLFRVAADAEAVRTALAEMIVASIGPACSEALEAHGVIPTLEAESPEMGPFADLVATRAPALLCRG